MCPCFFTKMKKTILLFVILFSGCCVLDRTIEKITPLTSVISKINPSAKIIQKGMSKEEVIEAWGKPDWYGIDESEWFYSNVEKSNVKNPVTYDIFFADNKVLTIMESLWSEKKWMHKTFDL